MVAKCTGKRAIRKGGGYFSRLGTKDSKMGKKITNFKKQAEYVASWEYFFTNWRNEFSQSTLREGFTHVISSLKSTNETLNSELSQARKSIITLKSRLNSMENYASPPRLGPGVLFTIPRAFSRAGGERKRGSPQNASCAQALALARSPFPRGVSTSAGPNKRIQFLRLS